MIAARSRLKRFLFALSLSLSLSPVLAMAAPEADRATARTLANEAQEAFDKGDFAKAADRFARADALFHAPTLLLGLARAQVGLGKLISAAETYNRLISEGVPPRSPQPFVKAVEDAEKELAATESRIPHVVIDVRGSPDAIVTLDGAPIPRASLGVKRPLDPGLHVLHAKAPKLFTDPVTLTFAEGALENVTLELKPLPPPPAVEAPPSPFQKNLSIAALSVGGAGLLLGGITGVFAIRRHNELTPLCDLTTHVCPQDQQATLTSFHTLATLSTVGFVVGTTLVAGGVVLFVTSPRPKPKAEAFLTPTIGLGSVGLQGIF